MLHINTFFFFTLLYCSSARIRVTGSRFPIDLGNVVRLKIESVQPGETVRVKLNGDVVNLIKYDQACIQTIQLIKCNQFDRSSFDLEYLPSREDYMKKLQVEYYLDLTSLELGKPEIVYDEQVELISSPKDLEIKFFRDNHVMSLPLSDKRDTEYETGDRFKVICKSEGSLPPSNISLNLSCRPRSPAIIESTRLKLARKNAPYELYFPNFDFDTETNPDKFASLVANYDAFEELKDKIVTPGEKEVVAHFTATKRLDKCQISCSQDKAEVISNEINVKYPTSYAYLLPRPENGFVRAGDTLGCYADGNPPPIVRLEAFVPKTKEQTVDQEMILFMDTHKTIPPVFGAKGILTHKKIGTIVYNESNAFYHQYINIIRSLAGHIRFIPIQKESTEDFTIKGSQLFISSNATIGKEVIVICFATGVEVHSRFIVTYRYNASLGVVLGICAGMLFLSVVILSLMIIMKRRQKQSNTAYQARKTNQGYHSDQVPITKKPPQPGPKASRQDKEYDYHTVLNGNNISNKQHHHQQLSSKHQTPMRTLDNVSENPYETTRNCDYQQDGNEHMSTFTRNNKNQNLQEYDPNFQSIEEDAGKHYATLDFTQTMPSNNSNTSVERTPVHSAGYRSNSLVGGPTQPSNRRRILSKSAATSSTTLFGAINKVPPRSVTGSSGGQMQDNPNHVYRSDDQDDGKITDVIAVLRPKESSINGVEAQQYEYLQSLLEMKRKKDSEFV